MSLPIKTTVEDINAIVGYLRTKPTGATLAEADAALGKTSDRRKISAFIFWGIVTRDDDRIKLSVRGWELARQTKTQEQALLEILDSIIPYRSALEWIFHQKINSVTNSDVAAHWHEHHSTVVGTDNENTIKDQAVCFFRLVEGAGIGKLTIGRKGAATRLDVDRSTLQLHIESGPTAVPLVESIEELEDNEQGEEKPGNSVQDLKPPSGNPASTDAIDLKVFITHGKNLELVEQVETMLQVADIQSEVAIKEESAAIPVPEKVFSAMRRCSAAIIIVSGEQVHSEPDAPISINPNVLIEIGAAFVLYDRRVILLWEKGVPVPSNLQGLYRCEFEGKEISWAAGMKLLKAIKEFRK